MNRMIGDNWRDEVKFAWRHCFRESKQAAKCTVPVIVVAFVAVFFVGWPILVVATLPGFFLGLVICADVEGYIRSRR